MTFTSEQNATWGQTLADLATAVTNAANWTVKENTAGAGNPLTYGDELVFGTSTPGEDLRLVMDAEHGGLTVEHGVTYDVASSSWTTRYDYDPASIEAGAEERYQQEPFDILPGDYNDTTPRGTDPTEGGTYWLEFVDGKGFGLYFQREVGDGHDGDVFLGMAKVNKAWDYSSAETREAGWVLGLADSNEGIEPIWLSDSGEVVNNEKRKLTGSNDYVAWGHVNPDNNFDNYPMTNNIVSSPSYRSVQGEDTVIGDFDLWTVDRSGSSTGHKDLIQDDTAADIYTILKREGTFAIALRME